jgi:hypothetical protein
MVVDLCVFGPQPSNQVVWVCVHDNLSMAHKLQWLGYKWNLISALQVWEFVKASW